MVSHHRRRTTARGRSAWSLRRPATTAHSRALRLLTLQRSAAPADGDRSPTSAGATDGQALRHTFRYINTVGRIEPSYVIQKFLDAQRIHNLTK